LWRIIYSKDKKLILFIGFIIGLHLLLLANAKSPVLGVVFGMLFFLFNRNKKYYLFIITISLIIFFFIQLFEYNLSFFRFLNFKDQGVDIRIEIYRSYVEAISRNVILPLMDPEITLLYAHNILFAIYSGTGIFGLIIFLYLIYFTLMASFRLIYCNTSYGWAGLIFICTLTISLFSGSFLDESFWIMLTLVNIYFQKQKKPLATTSKGIRI
jgi:O-antigen ligase